MITIILSMILTLGVVVFVHELGHFLAARAVGIHVHRFSIGLGPVILRWRGFGTEWALSLLPFGGYVKMAGMEAAPMEGEVPEGEEDLPPEALYRNKSIPRRLFAILAGPLANLVTALLLFSGIVYYQGDPVIPHLSIRAPAAESPAALAGLQRGDQILALDGQALPDWNSFETRLRAGGGRVYQLLVARGEERLDVSIDLSGIPLESMGWREARSAIYQAGLLVLFDNRVGRLQRGGPAAELGLQEGDRIVEVQGAPTSYYDDIAKIINASPETSLRIVWERDGQIMSGEVVPMASREPDQEEEGRFITVGHINFAPYTSGRHNLGLGTAISSGIERVGFTSRETLTWLGRMVTGRGSRESVGGPVLIAKVAGEMARWGLDSLLGFIAFFSTQLFLLNLLPVPVLDGGHVVFLLLEAIGRPVNENVRMRLTMVGLFLLLGLMAFILLLDIGRVMS